jgi:hypothetical protein
MKDWCMKHPIMTFLLLDKFICALEALFIGARRMCISERIVSDVNEAGMSIVSKIEEKSSDEDRTIGFKAS